MALIANVLVAARGRRSTSTSSILEMFLWRTERGMQAFGTDQAFADRSAPLAANQGLYNGFLVAGLVWGLIAARSDRFPGQGLLPGLRRGRRVVRRGDGQPAHPRRAGSPCGACAGSCRGRSQHRLTRAAWSESKPPVAPVRLAGAERGSRIVVRQRSRGPRDSRSAPALVALGRCPYWRRPPRMRGPPSRLRLQELSHHGVSAPGAHANVASASTQRQGSTVG